MDMKETIRELLRSLSGCGEFRDTDGLQDVLGLDSLAMVTLLARLEDAFGIRLDESDMNPYELVCRAGCNAAGRKIFGESRWIPGLSLPLVQPFYSTYHYQAPGLAVAVDNPTIRNFFLNDLMLLQCETRFCPVIPGWS